MIKVWIALLSLSSILLEELIYLKDRGKAGMTVEASGLYLIEVKY